MKKGFLFALAALCVSAAQAVTLTWEGSFTLLKDHAAMYVIAVADVEANAVAKIKEYYLDGGENIGSIKTRSNSVEMSDIHTYVLSNNSNSWGGSRQNLNEDGKPQTISGELTILRSSKSEYTNLTPEAITLLFFDAKGWTGADSYRYNSDLVDAYQLSETELSTLLSGTDLKVNVGNITIVPEPTALALLALGVAGLALRRKIA